MDLDQAEVRAHFNGFRDAMQSVLDDLTLLYEDAGYFKCLYLGNLIAIIQNDLIDHSIKKTEEAMKRQKGVV